MVVSEIELLLQSAMGLQVDTIGRSSLERAVHRRMKALNLHEPVAYVQRLKQASAELNELIEEVVIPETWFFRDTQPFEALLQHLADREWQRRPDVYLRLLSAPCATGEEPYSLAIALLRAGWSPDRFQIFAMDISTRALARAQKAEYTDHSFRGQDNDFKKRYFTRIGTSFVRYVLNRDIRQQVIFQHGNLLDPTFMAGLGLFDILFCRNVLIYLGARAREQAIDTLHRMLAPDGLLLVGHAETALFHDHRFEPAPYPRAFAFYKNNKPLPGRPEQAAPAENTGKTTGRRPAAARAVPPLAASPRPLPRRAPAAPRPSAILGSTPPDEDLLSRAQQLADQGKLAEAAGLCETFLRQKGPASRAYFLLGVTRDADGDPEEAAKMFRKAVYLQPDHTEALVYLALLAQRAGNRDEAIALRQRLERLESRRKNH